ncbi:mucin-5AC-like [Ostrinia furnacalis]|uniref:mucin-5AC-like n=1 Tax=Ostrinia furnacalis TaxID=93504 RepID=UPI00103A25C3|nr:mucin-5AC-like [Ostrinia furnacalis]
MRTVSAKMYGARLWLAAAGLQLLLLTATGARHHRRSMPTQATLPVSKGGWRPVVGSGGLVYGSYGTASLHAPTYKYPLPVLDLYQSSSRPLATRDSAKLTSIAQSYRPTTLRTVQAAQPAPPANQPINSYHNPFVFTNNGVSYKYIQNYPLDSVVIRNPQNPYAARPVFKYSNNKIKQQPLQNTVLQQLNNVQPIQFGQYQTSKPLDVFKKPVEGYARPTENKPNQSGTEIYKPEVYKLQDSEPAPQQVSQQVKTAQQQQALIGTQKPPHNPYPHYTYQDPVYPPNILGSFGAFGLQPVKGSYPTKTTYLPPQPNKQTIFNSFNYSPSFKTTPTIFTSTTPKLQTTVNHIPFAPTVIDYKSTSTTPPKLSQLTPAKIDPNAGNKGSFKASPQDPFIKHYQSDYNKIAVTTYNPVQTTTPASNQFSFDYNYQLQQNNQAQTFYDPQTQNYNYQKKKQKIHDSVAAGVNQATHQYASPPKSVPSYEVIETTESDDIVTHSAPQVWNQQPYDSNPKTTEETVTKQLHPDVGFSKYTTTPVADLPEEYAIVTEAEKGYENSLGYDSEVESQSRRPLGDDFEPIGKHKLKDYYYKVSTPTYEHYSTSKRTKKPTESSRLTDAPEVTTYNIIKETVDDNTEALPTLPPYKHFKRPSTTDTPIDKEKIRKRNKNRRRRPPLANINHNKESGTSTTRKYVQSTTELPQTTESDEVHTIRPRIRPAKLKQQPNLTTPSVTTDSTTSAVPTISPTAPTIIKKKLVRRPLTTVTDRIETTTQAYKDYDNSKDSSIMKIANRPQYPKIGSTEEIPDFSHKQDEKDTPTSDVDVSLESIKSSADAAKSFAFHKDVKPIEAKLETTTESFRVTNEVTESTSTSRSETTSGNIAKIQRPRLKNKFNRTRFSVKDYRNRLSSTTSTTERSTESTPKLRFLHRKATTDFNTESETTTERKKFMPKDPRHKVANGSELNEEIEKEIHSIRHPSRQRQTTTTTENAESTTQKISSRIRNGVRRPKPTEETTETTSPTTVHSKRPQRKKITDSELGESVQDISVTDSTVIFDHKNDITSERTRSESAIMKIADKKHHDHHIEHLFEHSKRVSDLTLAASKDYNTPGMFKTVSSNSRRIPNYFTIATDDPILPIEAFFPQLNQKKES